MNSNLNPRLQDVWRVVPYKRVYFNARLNNRLLKGELLMDSTSAAHAQSKLSSAPSTGNAPSQNQVAPTSLSEIPGLGPIRVRALQKAGLSDLKALKEISIERLVEVPGLSEIKAKYIQEYLGQFALLEPEAKPTLGLTNTGELENAKSAVGLGSSTTRLIGAGTLALGEIINLLLIPQASEYRSRLLREIGRIAQRTQALLLDAEFLTLENQEKAIKRLKRSSEEIGNFARMDPADRKVQSKLCDALEELGAKLAECGLSNEASTEAEA